MTEVGKHLIREHGNSRIEDLEYKVLLREKDNLKRKIKESFFIKKINPNLNDNKGISTGLIDYLVLKHQ